MKRVILFLSALFAIFLIVVAMQPSDFKVVRTTTINAPTPIVFEQINNLRNWEAWSPWIKMEPNVKMTYSGPDAGPGATYEWEGEKTGKGRMHIVRTTPPNVVNLKVDFISPFEASNDCVFTLVSADGPVTTLEWAMSGKNNFVSKIMALLMDMDKAIGSDFEKGLADIKTISEAKTAGK